MIYIPSKRTVSSLTALGARADRLQRERPGPALPGPAQESSAAIGRRARSQTPDLNKQPLAAAARLLTVTDGQRRGVVPPERRYLASPAEPSRAAAAAGTDGTGRGEPFSALHNTA